MIATFNFPDGENRQYKKFRYPGGEVQVRLTDLAIRMLENPSTDKVHIVARIVDGEIIPVAQLIDAIKGVTTADIVLILPYLPYARGDRRFVDGDCVGVAVFARMLNQFAGVQIVTLDAHSNRAAQLIRHFTDVSPKPIIDAVIQTLSVGSKKIGVMLPDQGATRYGIPTIYQANKVRNPETGKLSGFTVPSKYLFAGLDGVLIVDDICDGGGTFNGIADEMKDYGVDLYLYVTHGIFSKGFDELGKRFRGIYTTDSFITERSCFLPPREIAKLTVIPCIGTILDKIVDRSTLWGMSRLHSGPKC